MSSASSLPAVASSSLPIRQSTADSINSDSSSARASDSQQVANVSDSDSATRGPRFRNAYLRVILLGTVDPASPLRHLRGLTNTIFRRLIYPRVEELWQAHIVPGMRRGGEKGKQFMSSRGFVKFPSPRNININMMPFVLGDVNTLPVELRHYWPLIQQCDVAKKSEPYDQVGSVVYLTIHESAVEPNCSQRRSGLHTESPGAVLLPIAQTAKSAAANTQATTTKAKVNAIETSLQKMSLNHSSSSSNSKSSAVISHLQRVGEGESRRHREEAFWGRGTWSDYPKDGLYMVSSVGSSCQLWDASLKDPTVIVGPLGDLEHLRPVLGDKGLYRPRANELMWLTDLTPHESLPSNEWTTKEEDEARAAKGKIRKGAGNVVAATTAPAKRVTTVRYRQYFRLVTKDISVWYARHSTPNPFGIKPPASVTIIEDDKFQNSNQNREENAHTAGDS